MIRYFEVAADQLLERARYLASLIPRQLTRDVAALDVACRDRLAEIVRSLERVRDDAAISAPVNVSVRLRLLRRARADLDRLEYVAVSVLHRWTETDTRINKLAEKLGREIGFPLTLPVVAGLSQNYYHTYPDLRLICIPLAEGRFLLHLPDLYHELGHSLFAFATDARLDAFQKHCLEFNGAAAAYLESELELATSGFSPRSFELYLTTWLRSWFGWSIEAFCDLFALYMVGPAYAWAHLHLCVSSGGDPFETPLVSTSTHPPDGARMELLLRGLTRLGFHHDRQAVEGRWHEFLGAAGAGPSPEYNRCFPSHILDMCEQKAHDAVATLGCCLAQPPLTGSGRALLNEAWNVFWRDQSGFAAWERDASIRLLADS
jgi:hypothetical protein